MAVMKLDSAGKSYATLLILIFLLRTTHCSSGCAMQLLGTTFKKEKREMSVPTPSF